MLRVGRQFFSHVFFLVLLRVDDFLLLAEETLLGLLK